MAQLLGPAQDNSHFEVLLTRTYWKALIELSNWGAYERFTDCWSGCGPCNSTSFRTDRIAASRTPAHWMVSTHNSRSPRWSRYIWEPHQGQGIRALIWWEMDGWNGLPERGTTDSLATGLTSCLEGCEVGFARSVFSAPGGFFLLPIKCKI